MAQAKLAARAPRRLRRVLPLGARALWGSVLLARPGALTWPRAPRRAERAAIRVLGARQLIQSAVLLRLRGPRARLLGAGVDCAHALSMLALVRARAGSRRAALSSFAVSAAFAAEAIEAAARDRPRECRESDSGGARATGHG